LKCSIFSLSLLHSKQSIFASFLNIFIRLLWSMYEPVSRLSLVGKVRKPILQEIEEILNDKETSWKCLPQDTKIQLLLDITSVISKLNLDPMSNILVCRSIWSWNMRRREQYSMFATLAGSKLSLLITDVMSSNSWIFVSCGRHFRLPTKLKLLTGSYILQSNRIKMFKNEANILCLLCSKDKEKIEHFILDCERLEEVRKPILQEIALEYVRAC
jgi:hypothetical protein